MHMCSPKMILFNGRSTLFVHLTIGNWSPSLLSLIRFIQPRLTGHGEDQICWKNDGIKGFKVRLYYRVLIPCVGFFSMEEHMVG